MRNRKKRESDKKDEKGSEALEAFRELIQRW